MKLGANLGYWIPGLAPADQLAFAVEAERLGYDSVWAAEAYGSDAATVLAWLAGRDEQDQARVGDLPDARASPAMTAMTAATIDDALGRADGARDRLLGTAGGRGLARAAVRAPAPADPRVRRGAADGAGARAGRVPRRDARAAAPGWSGQAAEADDLARPGPDPDLPGRDRARRTPRWPARSPTGGCRCSSRPSTSSEVRALLEGGAAASGRSLDELRHGATVNTYISDDREAARNLMRPVLALYIGGMGSRKQNFYNQLVQRYGFEDAAVEGPGSLSRRQEGRGRRGAPRRADRPGHAVRAPKDRVRDRLAAFRDAGVGTLTITPDGVHRPRADRAAAGGGRAGGLSAPRRSAPRVFLGAFGEPGHAFPMLALGARLAERGHEVTFETWSRWREDVEAAGMRFVPAPEYPLFPGAGEPFKMYEAVVRATGGTRARGRRAPAGCGRARHPDARAGDGRRARGRAGGDADPAPVPGRRPRVPAVRARRAAAANAARPRAVGCAASGPSRRGCGAVAPS